MSDQAQGWVGQLAAEHGRMVFAVAYRVLGNADDAEDAAQEVFLKLLRGTEGEGRARNWPAYLRTMATTCSIDLLRRKRGGGELTIEWLESLPAPEADGPAHLIERKQRSELLRAALARLPDRDAQIFGLRHFEEFSYEEIAEQLAISPGQVGVILHRTRHRLIEMLQPLMQTPRRQPNHERDEARKSRV